MKNFSRMGGEEKKNWFYIVNFFTEMGERREKQLD